MRQRDNALMCISLIKTLNVMLHSFYLLKPQNNDCPILETPHGDTAPTLGTTEIGSCLLTHSPYQHYMVKILYTSVVFTACSSSPRWQKHRLM